MTVAQTPTPEVIAARRAILAHLRAGNQATHKALANILNLPPATVNTAMKGMARAKTVVCVGSVEQNKWRVFKVWAAAEPAAAVVVEDAAPIDVAGIVASALASRPVGVPSWLGGAA
jgi:hypothetical protein